MITFEELKERLKQLDELTLLDLLGVTSEELVEKFEDTIEEDFDYYYEQVKEESDSTRFAV